MPTYYFRIVEKSQYQMRTLYQQVFPTVLYTPDFIHF